MGSTAVHPSAQRRRTPLRQRLDLPTLCPELAAAIRGEVPDLAEQIAASIRSEVAVFDAMTRPGTTEEIRRTVRPAVVTFVDALSGAPTCGTDVLDLFRRLGASQADRGHTLDALRAAHHAATRRIRDQLVRLAEDLHASSDTVPRLTEAVLAYQDELLDAAEEGHRAMQTPERVAQRARRRLFDALVAGTRSPAEVEALAERCGWTVPDSVAAVACTATELTDHRFPSEALVGRYEGRLMVLADVETAQEVADELTDAITTPVSLTWGVQPTEAHHSARWARLGLELCEQHLLTTPDSRLLTCEDVQPQLCAHADRELRRQVDAKVLAPLMEENPKRRLVLAETMRAFLQDRTSAPRLANAMGVHHRTIRLRLSSIRSIFGKQIDDPNETATLILALESAVTQWQSE